MLTIVDELQEGTSFGTVLVKEPIFPFDFQRVMTEQSHNLFLFYFLCVVNQQCESSNSKQ